MNQIFGYQILPGQASSNKIIFDGTQLVLPSSSIDDNSYQVKIFSQSHSHLQSCFSQKYNAYSYVWGIPVHPEIATKDIPEWCANVVVDKRYDRFKELIGTFVIIIDEPDKHRITFVTDILGIRPMFISENSGRFVFGSNVWSMYEAGLSNGKIDYDAVSAWIAYGFNCTDGTLFSDLRRLPPGSAVILQDGQYTEIQYAKFESKSQTPKIEQVSEEIHHIVSSTMKLILNNHDRITVSLSGGYDSRYLLALSLSLGKVSIECATVSFTENEGKIASQVAETLGLPIKKYHVNGSIWDFYDEVYHFMADGFPISKFVPYRIAHDYPGIPMMNGFMGDVLIRGDSDRFRGKYETEWEDNPVDVLQCKHTKINFRLLRKEIARKIQMRSRSPMEKAVQEGSKLSKVLGWQDYYYTHRFYISNNFLQHIELAEALIPFYNWPLLSYKMEHAYKVFNKDTYQGIFQKYFPKLANIPRASDIYNKNNKPSKVAVCTKKWSEEILPIIFNKNSLSLLQKKLCIPLDIAGIIGLRRTEFAMFTFKRLYMLEKRTRDAGLDFDWDCI